MTITNWNVNMNVEVTTDVIWRINRREVTNKWPKFFQKVTGTWSWRMVDAGKQQWMAMKPNWHHHLLKWLIKRRFYYMGSVQGSDEKTNTTKLKSGRVIERKKLTKSKGRICVSVRQRKYEATVSARSWSLFLTDLAFKTLSVNGPGLRDTSPPSRCNNISLSLLTMDENFW